MRRFIFMLDNGVTLTINPPSIRLYYREFLTAKNDNQLFTSIAKICDNNAENIRTDINYVLDNFSAIDFNRFMKEFPEWVNGERDSDPN